MLLVQASTLTVTHDFNPDEVEEVLRNFTVSTLSLHHLTLTEPQAEAVTRLQKAGLKVEEQAVQRLRPNPQPRRKP